MLILASSKMHFILSNNKIIMNLNFMFYYLRKYNFVLREWSHSARPANYARPDLSIQTQHSSFWHRINLEKIIFSEKQSFVFSLNPYHATGKTMKFQKYTIFGSLRARFYAVFLDFVFLTSTLSEEHAISRP